MRRSPPAFSCLMGLDLRKRPFADLTPEEAPADAAEPPEEATGDMTLAVEVTADFEHTVCRIHNPHEQCKR